MDRLKRGDVVTVAGAGDFAGKPRPAVVVQADLFNDTHASLTVVPITTTVMDADLFRIVLKPSTTSGLRRPSQAMVDKITSVRRDRIGPCIGALSNVELDRIDQSLRTWLAL